LTDVMERQVLGTNGAPVEPVTVVAVKRRTVDTVLIWLGVVATAVLAAAGGLLFWGASFAENYVEDELTAQNVTFPDAEALIEDGREDLVRYAGEQVSNGAGAEAYASYIEGHLDGIADGMTYSELGGPQRAAQAAVTDATEAGAPAEEIEALQAEAAALTGQRDTIFRGEMLRGTLLNTFAWDTVGQIAFIASVVAFVGAGVMLILVLAGVFHLRKLQLHR
jgi:hypothetical protein